MSNRLFHGIIHQMKDAIDRVIGVVDETSETVMSGGDTNKPIGSGAKTE